MKRTIRLTVILAVVVTGMAVTSLRAQDYFEKNGDQGLPGAWDTNVTIYNCETGATIRQFASLGIFNSGGTFSGITSGTPPFARTPELGVWQHVTGHEYTLRFKAFLFDAAGNPTGYQIVTHQLRLSGNGRSYISGGGVQIFTMAGVQVGTGCSWASGTRMTVP